MVLLHEHTHSLKTYQSDGILILKNKYFIKHTFDLLSHSCFIPFDWIRMNNINIAHSTVRLFSFTASICTIMFRRNVQQKHADTESHDPSTKRLNVTMLLTMISVPPSELCPTIDYYGLRLQSIFYAACPFLTKKNSLGISAANASSLENIVSWV